jgi:hypothetical protein
MLLYMVNNPVLVGARFYDDVTQPNKFQFQFQYMVKGTDVAVNTTIYE